MTEKSKKQPEEVFFSLEEPIDFKCVQPEKGCFSRKDNTICVRAPCELMKERFGTHERIKEFYLENDQWDEAYYYFKDLLSISIIDCDLEELEKIKEKKGTDLSSGEYPAGCRVFYISKELNDLRKSLKYFNGKEYEKLSKDKQDKWDSCKKRFIRKMDSVFELLSHLVKNKRQLLKDNLLDMKYNLLVVGTQMGDLKPQAMDLPIHKDVKDTIEKKNDGKDKDKISGI